MFNLIREMDKKHILVYDPFVLTFPGCIFFFFFLYFASGSFLFYFGVCMHGSGG